MTDRFPTAVDVVEIETKNHGIKYRSPALSIKDWARHELQEGDELLLRRHVEDLEKENVKLKLENLPPQAIEVLEKMNEVFRTQDVADKLGIKKQNASKLVRKLEDSGAIRELSDLEKTIDDGRIRQLKKVERFEQLRKQVEPQ